MLEVSVYWSVHGLVGFTIELLHDLLALKDNIGRLFFQDQAVLREKHSLIFNYVNAYIKQKTSNFFQCPGSRVLSFGIETPQDPTIRALLTPCFTLASTVCGVLRPGVYVSISRNYTSCFLLGRGKMDHYNLVAHRLWRGSHAPSLV